VVGFLRVEVHMTRNIVTATCPACGKQESLEYRVYDDIYEAWTVPEAANWYQADDMLACSYECFQAVSAKWKAARQRGAEYNAAFLARMAAQGADVPPELREILGGNAEQKDGGK